MIFSSYELLELFGVTVINPEMYTVTAYVWDGQARVERRMDIPVDPDSPARLIPADRKPERIMRIDFAPEDGVLAAALREGRRPEWKQAIVQTANVSAIFRSAKFPNADISEYGEQLFLPIERLREFEEQQRLRAAALRGISEGEPDGLYALWHE